MLHSSALLLTCEHAGNQVPERYRHLFGGDEEVLHSHRGWDPGAWHLARHLAASLRTSVVSCHISRLLIEVNRSVDHPDLFSSFSDLLPLEEKNYLKEKIYHAYRTPVQECIKSSARPVVHLSVHSFTPVLGDQARNLEVGILFDPERKKEHAFSSALRTGLRQKLPDFRISFNEPYRGIDDGFTTHLRTVFPDERYAGIEIEINQKLIDTGDWAALKIALVDVLSGL